MAELSGNQLPEHARNYIETIDLQIALITGFEHPQHDYEHALADQVTALRELKELVRADPSICSFATAQKRPAEVDDNDETISSARPARRIRIVRQLECSTCLDSHLRGDVTILKCCKTIYCTPCFGQWFKAALATKQLPKCCDIGIEPKEYHGKLGRDLTKQYKAVVREVEAERRLWCANMACRAFIKIEQDTSGFIQCGKCRRKTCATCAGSTSVHKGRRRMCPNHLTDGVLESTMIQNKWKRCPRCHVVVEKKSGCNNVRCTCGIIFCFRCGVSKTSEAGICKCSHPKGVFTEPTEDPDSD